MKRKHVKKKAVQSVLGQGIAIAGIAVVALIGTYIARNYRIARTCANSISCIADVSGEFQTGRTSTYMGRTVDVSPQFAHMTTGTQVLGNSTDEKHVYVDLSTQMLTAYNGRTVVMSFPVSTGRWYPTPTGEFRIWVKMRYTHMEGGNQSDGTYYNIYNVPYTMYFYSEDIPKSRGFGLHGAFWHNNFGHPMSHGCVNIRPVDAGKLYDWIGPATDGGMTYATADNPGTRLTITGMTPEE